MLPPETHSTSTLPIHSWLDQWKRRSPEAHVALRRLAEAGRTRKPLVEADLDQWLTHELGLIEPEAEQVPWFDLLVTRWRGADRVAFDGDNVRCSYDELERVTAARSRAWRAAGVRPGTIVCICRPFGYELVADLLTAFRLGASAAWVPAYGEPYERAALRTCQAEYVVFDAAVLRRVRDPAPAVLLPRPLFAGEQLGNADDVAASYARGAPCLEVLSPTAGEPDGDGPSWQWSSLACGALLRATARDAALVWRLRPGDALGAPGFDGPRHQPSLLLACLLAGACYVHRTREQIEREPSCLARDWRTIGVRAALVDQWSTGLTEGATADVCFRDLEEPWSADVWNRFQDRIGSATEVAAVLVEPAVGGAVLSTSCSEARFAGAVRVLPGIGYQLAPPEGSPPTSRLGVLSVEAEARPYVLLWSLGDECYRYFGASGSRRSGCAAPHDIWIEAVRRLPGVHAASRVALPGGDPEGGACFGLIVFVHSPLRWDDERAALVRRSIERFLAEVLAPEIRPDFVECYPLCLPHAEDTTAAASWVMEQWLRGALKKKARLSVFRRLAALHAGGA